MRITFRTALLACAFLLAVAGVWAQTVEGLLLGTLLDPASAVVPGATITLTETDTGATRVATTDSAGVFRFPNIPPGNYSISVQASGFKNLVQSQIMVGASETRDLGKLTLTLGNTSEKIQVIAEATAVQLSSSEKAQLVDSQQLEDVTLKGRDLFGYMKLVPGVIDRAGLLGDPGAGNRDVASENGIRAITINGNASALNFTVDGITDMDTGSNGTLHYEPNIDAIQELKILTSNYQAEFGRNSGGTITAITKSGTQSFHGSFMWNHRNEGLDANLWTSDRNGRKADGTPVSPISLYRYNVETYTIGGPIMIPHHFNTQRKKLFFFWSQEYTGQFVSGGVQTKYTPTALERQGNFSQSFQNNGNLIVINDPTTGAPFPGNVIPQNRITPLGQAMLNFFPLPNFVGTGSLANIDNYTEGASATHPHRNDVLRADTYITSKINGYFRYINDHDDMLALYQGVQFTKDTGGLLGDAGISPIDHPNPGHGYSGSIIYNISPTMVNEFTMGKSWNTWSYYSTDNYKTEDRGLLGTSIPALFPLPTGTPSGASKTNGYFNVLPEFQFGSSPQNYMNYTRVNTSAGNYENFNPIWTFADNLSKVIDKHTLKGGIYIEHNTKIQPSGPPYAGNFNFTVDTLNNLNTGDGFANGLLGYVDSYQQATGRAVFSTQYWNVEWYIQDNFRVTRKLTLDYGVRFYHQTPQADLNYTFSNFVPSLYSKSAAPRLYIPGTSNGKRVAIDPGTGAVAPVAYIGLYVPNSGNPADGFQLLNKQAPSLNPYTTSWLAVAPRVGFAYDIMGDGKTALRGGFGIFYNRLDGNQVYNLSGQPPVVYQPQVNYATLDQIASSGNNLVFGPGTFYDWPAGNVPWDRTQNASLNLQRQLPGGMVIDVGYTGDWEYNQQLSYDINPIPIGTRYPFNQANLDTTNGKTLPDVLLRTVFPGYSTINQYGHKGSTNYNAMTVSLQRRYSHGLAMGIAYTWGHSLGVQSYNPVVPNNQAWNYGRSGFDIRNNIQANYSYDIPGLGKMLGSKVLGAITDRWTLSGIITLQSGIPFNPGGPNVLGTGPDYTGTPDVGARVNVVGDPFSNVPAGHYFNPAAFAPPAYGTTITTPVLGDLQGGSGVMSLPWIWNVDVTMAKFIPLWGERHGLKIACQAYNVLNHPEFNNVNTGIQWDATGNVSNMANAGVYSSTLPARILALSARFEF